MIVIKLLTGAKP